MSFFKLRRATVPIVLSLLFAGGVSSQEGIPPWQLGGTLHLASPTGDFKKNIDFGVGVGGYGIRWLDARSRVGLRAGGALTIYDTYQERIPVSPIVPIDQTLLTSHGLVALDLGPQLQLSVGRVRPFARAGVGGAFFFTDSQLGNSNCDANDTCLYTLNHHDLTWSWSAGGGLAVLVRDGYTPISVEAEISFRGNGNTRYLFGELPPHYGERDRDWGRFATEGEANFTSFRLGASFGVW